MIEPSGAPIRNITMQAIEFDGSIKGTPVDLSVLTTEELEKRLELKLKLAEMEDK